MGYVKDIVLSFEAVEASYGSVKASSGSVKTVTMSDVTERVTRTLAYATSKLSPYAVPFTVKAVKAVKAVKTVKIEPMMKRHEKYSQLEKQMKQSSKQSVVVIEDPKMLEYKRVGIDKFVTQSVFQATPPTGHSYMHIMLMLLMNAIKSNDYGRVGTLLNKLIKESPKSIGDVRTTVKTRFITQLQVAQLWHMNGLMSEVSNIVNILDVYVVENEYYNRLF